MSQLLLIVDGEGYVCGANKEKVKIGAGQAVFWEKGEFHETSTEKGLMAIVIESDGLENGISMMVRGQEGERNDYKSG